MYSLVSTCIRPKANTIDESAYEKEFVLTKEGTGDTMNDDDSSSSILRQDSSQSSIDEQNINSDQSDTDEDVPRMLSEKGVKTSSDVENQSPRIPTSLLIQSPSRGNRTIPSDDGWSKQREVKLLYSPLCNEASRKIRGKTQHELELISRVNDLMTHHQRWKFQSQLCGNHAVPIHVLDLSRREVSPESLQCGVTPQTALAITDLSFNSSVLSKYNLPSLLDTIVDLFPNLEHLSFITDIEENHLSSEEHHKEGFVYSADDPDDVTPSSLLGVKGFIPNLDKINVASAEKYKKDQAESMQRLYILYRIPRLKSINGKRVSDEEYRLACPNSGKKLPDLSRKLLDLRAESKLIIFDADGNHSDCKLSTIGVEMTLNQHLCSDSPLVKEKKSPESVALHVDSGVEEELPVNDMVHNHVSSVFSPSHVDSFEENDGTKDEVSSYELHQEEREESENGVFTANLDLYVKNTSNIKNNSPSSMQPSKSSLSSASILIANMKPFEGKVQTFESKIQPTSDDNKEQNSKASNGIASNGVMKKKLFLSRTRSSRPPPSPASILQGSQRTISGSIQRQYNTRPSSIVPIASLFDEESSEEEEEEEEEEEDDDDDDDDEYSKETTNICN
jgi:hypothetical protein